MEFLKIILLAVVFVSLSVLGLAIRILLKNGGKFPNTHVGGNKYLKRQGICCARTQDLLEQPKVKNQINYKKVKINPKSKPVKGE